MVTDAAGPVSTGTCHKVDDLGRWSTCHKVDDLGRWSQVVASMLMAAQMRPVQRSSFEGVIQHVHVGNFILVDMTSTAHVVERREQDSAAVPRNDLVFFLQMQGSVAFSQDKRNAVVNPGDFGMYDASRRFVAEVTSDFRALNLRIRPQRLGLSDRQISSLTASTISGTEGLSPLVSALLRSAGESLAPSAVTQPRATLAAAARIESLVGDVLRGHLEARGEAGTLQRRAGVDVDVVIELMRDRLDEPGLTADSIARQAHISRRQLHRLFQQRGETFSAVLRTMRLELATANLQRTEYEHVPISVIGARSGYATASHFSQAFRRHMGITPTEMRHSAASTDDQLRVGRPGGISPPVPPTPQSGSGGRSYGRLFDLRE